MLKCWKLKKEECCREFIEESRRLLGSREELPECWKSTDEVKCQDFCLVYGQVAGKEKVSYEDV